MKSVILAVTIAIALGGIGGLAAFSFFFTPETVAKEWLTCGVDQKRLLQRADRTLWDEYQAKYVDSLFATAYCPDHVEHSHILVRGFEATVKATLKLPKFAPEDFTDLPATATRDEKIRLIKQRAQNHIAKNEVTEGFKEVKLVFDGMRWKVNLDLANEIRLLTELDNAANARKSGDFSTAISIYERLISAGVLGQREQAVVKSRFGALSEMACREAAMSPLKYPQAAEFVLSTIDAIVKVEEPIHVYGQVLASNAMGIKSKYSTVCQVTLSTSKPKALVDLFMMLDPIEADGIISKKGMEITLK